MFLVSSFVVVPQHLARVMTDRLFHNFLAFLTGWVFACRRAVTGMLTAAGVAGQRHRAPCQRFFASARWSLDALAWPRLA